MEQFNGQNYIYKKIVEYFDNENMQNNICISGGWGYGKTTFIEKLKEYFDSSVYIYKIFNVWEYEISDNIFVSLIIDILYSLDFKDETKINIFQLLKNISFEAVKFFVKVDLKKITSKSINKEKKSDINSFKNSLEQIIFLIKEQLKELKEKNKRIIFVFDEMDRCTTNQIVELLNIIKNVFFRFKENIFFIVCCNSERIDKMLERNNDEPFTNKIFDKVIKIEYLINNESLFLTDSSNNYLLNFWKTRSECIRIKEKVTNSVSKIANSCLIQEDKEKFENLLYNHQMIFLLNVIYFEKYLDKNDEYKILIKNFKNIHNMKNEILTLLSGFSSAFTLLTSNEDQFPENKKFISIYDRVKKLSPRGPIHDMGFASLFLYVEINNNCRVPLSFFLPFFYKWEKFDDLKYNLYQNSNFLNTDTILLVLKYELIRENIMPSFRKSLDMLADEIKNYNYFMPTHITYENDNFFYVDILEIISKTLFD